MDLKNEKSKIYLFGKIFFSIGVIVLGIIFFMNNNSEILDIQQIFLSLFMALLGTQEVVAKKNKIGYLDYFVSVFILVVFIMK